MVLPWKYGFKSIKSIANCAWWKNSRPPPGLANGRRPTASFSNVNPNHDHPSWDQKEEQRLGEGSVLSPKVIKTQMFNGYGNQVSNPYVGLDLDRNY